MATAASRARPSSPLPDATPGRQHPSALDEAVTDPAELCRLLGLPAALAQGAHAACRSFGMRVPRSLIGRMEPGNSQDPILLQVLPKAEELEYRAGFDCDPLGESKMPTQRGIGVPFSASAAQVSSGECPSATCQGMLAKYPNRLLIVASDQCPVHCRFCFRRHFPFGWVPRTPDHWTRLFQTLARDSTAAEIILSGGDPLMLGDETLCWVLDRLGAIPHVQRVRFHTRVPVAIPQRVTDDLVALMRRCRPTVLVVVHVNHPAEIDHAVATSLGRWIDRGIPVLSQSVLLRGINDCFEVLAELYERLANLRVVPYYLHQLDRVAGAAHFEVPEARGIELMGRLRACLPGYAVPRYVREIPGEPNKHLLA